VLSALNPTFKPAVESLYLAAVHEEHWPQALAELSNAFDSPRVGLLRVMPGFGSVIDMRAFNHEPEAQRLYRDYYWRLDPSHLITRGAEVGQWLDRPGLYDPRTTPQPEYMNYAIRWGIRFVCGGKVHSDSNSETFVSLQRPKDHGPFGVEAARVFEQVGPHIGLAVSLAEELKVAQLSRGLAQAALDGLNGLVYAVDVDGRMMVANSCGDRQLAAGTPFCVRSGFLSADDSDVSTRLSMALRDARQRVGTGFRCCVGAETWLVRVLPISHLPGAAVVYAASTERSPVPTQILKQMLGFSASEAEVAYLMADGLSAKEIADSRCVSITTIRTQIREVLRKAGVRRQADLARLLFSVPRLHDAQER